MTRRLDGWTDAYGGLPEDYAERIVALDSGRITTAHYRSGGASGWYYANGEPIHAYRVLYWRDMPPHPDAKPVEDADIADRWLKGRDK